MTMREQDATPSAGEPDFETPLAEDEWFLCSIRADWRTDEEPIVTQNRRIARQFLRDNPKDHCFRVRLTPSRPSLGEEARTPMPVSPEQFSDFVAGALHGLEEDGTPFKDCEEVDETRFRDALDCAGLKVVSTTVDLFDPRDLGQHLPLGPIAGCEECAKQGRPCHQHWYAASRRALSSDAAPQGGERAVSVAVLHAKLTEFCDEHPEGKPDSYRDPWNDALRHFRDVVLPALASVPTETRGERAGRINTWAQGFVDEHLADLPRWRRYVVRNALVAELDASLSLAGVTGDSVADIRAEEKRILYPAEPALASSGRDDAVDRNAAMHRLMWRDKPDAYWLMRLMQEVGELASALADDHEHSPEHELAQIGGIAKNWMDKRALSSDAAPQGGERPEIVCLSGSTRFIDLMAVEAWELEKRGAVVLSCHLLPRWYTDAADHLAEEQGVAEAMDTLHLRKIDLADRVVVVTVDDYIGQSTAREIEYARSLGKPVEVVNRALASSGRDDAGAVTITPEMVEAAIMEVTPDDPWLPLGYQRLAAILTAALAARSADARGRTYV